LHSLAYHNVLVSDSETNFVSKEFTEFAQHNEIKHVTSAPDSLDESAVHTFKKSLSRIRESSIIVKLSCFLFSYKTPPATTGSILA